MVSKVLIGGDGDRRSHFGLARTGEKKICVIGGTKRRPLLRTQRIVRSILCFDLTTK